MTNWLLQVIRRVRREPSPAPIKVGGGIWFAPSGERPSSLHCDVFQTPDRLIVAPMVWNRQTGLQTATVPVVQIELSAPDQELGSAVASVLDAHQDEVLDMPTPSGPNTSLLRAAGVRRWRDFAPVTRCVGIDRDGDHYKVYASRNESTRHPRSGWFWILPERELDHSDPSTLGRAIRAALAECTFAPPIKHRKKRDSGQSNRDGPELTTDQPVSNS